MADPRNIYRKGPCLADELPDWTLHEYQRRYGTGPLGFASMIAMASHEVVFGDPWVRVSEVSGLLGTNCYPSVTYLTHKGWVVRREFEVSKRAPRSGMPGTASYCKLTELGWEYLTEFLGVKRNVATDAARVTDPEHATGGNQ